MNGAMKIACVIAAAIVRLLRDNRERYPPSFAMDCLRGWTEDREDGLAEPMFPDSSMWD